MRWLYLDVGAPDQSVEDLEEHDEGVEEESRSADVHSYAFARAGVLTGSIESMLELQAAISEAIDAWRAQGETICQVTINRALRVVVSDPDREDELEPCLRCSRKKGSP